MDSQIIAAIIGLGGTAVGAVLAHVLPNTQLFHRLSNETRHHSLLGSWHSTWGPMPSGPTKYEEDFIVTKQRGQRVEGYITHAPMPNRRWDFEGRYDGLFLQIYYFPSKQSPDHDFLSHGCYFFTRKADGSFTGYSTGYGEDEVGGKEGVTTDYHILKRKS